MPRFILPILLISFLSACGGGSDNPDIDGDGIANGVDAFPRDAKESMDTDGDGVGDNSDAFPADETETLDSDLDGVGDNTDAFPNDKDETLDLDGDGVGNNSDAFPDDENETLDSDGDGVGDNADEFPFDFDNDGIPDLTDMFPQDPNESIDSDGDGVGDNSDAFPNDKNQTTDSNCDGVGDNTDVEAIPDNTPGAGIGLGDGVGDAYHAGVVKTGLNEGETLSANGSTNVMVHVVEESCDNFALLSPQKIYFTSTCAQLGLAEFIPAMVIANGTAASVYHDMGCGKADGAADSVVAYLGVDDGSGNVIAMATARAEINVAPGQVGVIKFMQAVPSIIALKGLGTENTPSSSIVAFQVVNEFGNYVSERTVHFELDYEYGNAELSSESAITDQEGKVSVVLKAGYATGTVKIKASINILDANGDLDYTVTTMSAPIRMATSLGTQSNFTLSADVLNPAAWEWNDSLVNITARLGDHYQNSVVDGTPVYFRATGGLIEASCLTENGICSVKWYSRNPRPADGIVTIVAQARGQGGYQDSNGNGLYDLGESFTAYGESFEDANGNGLFDEGTAYQPDLDIDDDGANDFSWDAAAYQVNVASSGDSSVATTYFHEEIIDSNQNGILDPTPANKYQGVNCSESAEADGHCAEQIDLVKTLRLQLSAAKGTHIEGPFLWDANLDRYDTSSVATCVDASGSGGAKSIAWRVSDSVQRRNHLAFGSKVSLVTEDVSILSDNVGEIQSISPVAVLPVWEAGNNLTGDDKRYNYLVSRGHLFSAKILRPELFSAITGMGTIALKVATVDDTELLSNTLDVDLLGARVTLVSNLEGDVTSINLEENTQDFTLMIKNACGAGLEAGTLVITTSNGIISNPGASGSAGDAVVGTPDGINDNTLNATVDSSGAPTVVTFTLSKDSEISGTVLNALNISLSVPDPEFGFDHVTNIADYAVKD